MMDIDLEQQLFIPIFQAHKQSSEMAISKGLLNKLLYSKPPFSAHNVGILFGLYARFYEVISNIFLPCHCNLSMEAATRERIDDDRHKVHTVVNAA